MITVPFTTGAVRLADILRYCRHRDGTYGRAMASLMELAARREADDDEGDPPPPPGFPMPQFFDFSVVSRPADRRFLINNFA